MLIPISLILIAYLTIAVCYSIDYMKYNMKDAHVMGYTRMDKVTLYLYILMGCLLWPFISR